MSKGLMSAFIRAVVLVAITGSVTLVLAETKPVKISLVTQTPASVPAIPTADIAREVSKRCPNVIITRSPETAVYSLEAVGGERTNPHGQRLFKFTLFDRDGDVAFTTETRQLHNAVKDICTFINK
ncbi:MAG: hypothetical protein ABSD96_12770 [Candidatus Korobacteraceae bacterium]